ncbi:MAG: spoIVB 1 [Massilibacillus sp.]|nr:spoIVB 1 [Massilibacillus sp.]
MLLVVLLLPMSKVSATPEIMTTDQLQPGMQGIAKTVIQGTTIDTFDIEILGVVKEGIDSDGRILAKASGSVIDKTGGVLQGMSGSPVYIDGKLVGAVSGGWKDIDSRTCIITPIADMLKLWDMPDLKKDQKIKQVDLKAVLKADQQAADKTKEVDTTKEVGKELATPLMAAGFSDAAFNMLTEKLQPFNMVPYASSGVNGDFAPVTIEPGSSIGAQLVRGDFSLAAIGTVTAVEDGKVLAFGHPFLRKGNVNYFMTDANIISTASGLNTGFKIGVPGNAVGVINQDRTAAIAGSLGRYPSVIPLQVNVTDKQFNTTKSYSMQIAYDEQLAATLAATMVYNSIDQTIDRTGEGTAKVSFEIMSNAAPGGILKRDNMYYNPQDVGKLAIAEVFQALDILCGNNQNETDIVSVKVNVDIDQTRKTASIIEAIPEKTSVKAGEKVNIAVKIKPYRENEVILKVPYTVPKQQAAGMAVLEVRGGGLISVAQLLMQQQGFDLSAQEDKTKTLDMIIKEFLDTNKNNEIIIDQMVSPVDMTNQTAPQKAPVVKKTTKGNKESKENNKTVKNKPEEEPNNTKFATDYIIDNVVQTSINVEPVK